MNTAVTKTFPLGWNVKNLREADTILFVCSCSSRIANQQHSSIAPTLSS